uniref:Uncharacterized protein n=1 Tax=Rhizophora mucronata TaxID=61149 RepID=A0A2P2PR41_RHIMU
MLSMNQILFCLVKWMLFFVVQVVK